MAAGRAVIYVGPKEATPALLIGEHGLGWRIAYGDVAGLVSCLRRLRNAPSTYREAGARARAAFETEYDIQIGVRRVLNVIGIPTVNDTHASMPSDLRRAAGRISHERHIERRPAKPNR
jgi:hypothetical protein